MRVVTYFAAEARPGRKSVAFIERDGSYLPIHFEGPTEDVAKTRAEEWWTEETGKAQRKLEHRTKSGDRLKKRPATEPAPEPVPLDWMD